MLAQIEIRRDTAANWSSANPVLASGELGLDTTNRIVKIGDGATAWNSLTAVFYIAGSNDVAVSDGGTGVGTLTGLVKGNGTSAFTAGVAGTDYVAPGGALGTPSSGTLTNCTGLPVTGFPSDFVYVAVSPGTNRATGSGDFPVAQYVGRAFTLTKVVYQFDTADASGSSSVEVRRNGSQVASSNLTITSANQADGTGTDAARTATPSQSFSVGDRIGVQITAVGTTPGKGLRAYLLGTWN